MIELDLAAAAAEIDRVRFLLHVRLRIEHLQHAFARGNGALHILRQAAQRRQRRVKERKVHEKADDIRRRKLTAQRERPADGRDEHRTKRREKLNRRVIDAVGEIRMDVHAPVFPAHFRHALVFALLGGKGLYFLHAGDMILHIAAERAEEAAVDLEQRAHLARIERADVNHKRHGDQRNRGKKRVDGKQHRRNSRDDHQVRNQIRQRMRDQNFQRAGVVDHAAHDIADLVFPIPFRRKRLDMIVHVQRQRGHIAPRGHMRLPHRQKAHEPADDIRQRQQRGKQQNRLLRIRRGRAEDGGNPPDDRGRCKVEQRTCNQHGNGQRQRAAPGSGESQQSFNRFNHLYPPILRPEQKRCFAHNDMLFRRAMQSPRRIYFAAPCAAKICVKLLTRRVLRSIL